LDLIQGHLLGLETLPGLSAKAFAPNDDDLGAVTQAVDAGSSQEWILETVMMPPG